MREVGLTVYIDNVELASSCTNLLGYVVDDGKVCPSVNKLKAILDHFPPHREMIVHQSLGILDFNNQFTHNYA